MPKKECPQCGGSGKQIERGGWGVSWTQCRACGGSGEK
jgi:DnaJ-class molecular chaperone